MTVPMQVAAEAWYSPQQLAGLPGMPSDVTNVLRRAKKNLWPSRNKLRGKGLEYPISCLPLETKSVLTARLLGAQPTVSSSGASAPVSPAVNDRSPTGLSIPCADLTDAQRLERDARSGVGHAIRQLQAVTRCSQLAAMTTLLTNARAGKLEPGMDTLLRLARDKRGRAGDGLPSVRTLKRWLAAKDLTPKIPQKDMQVPAWARDFLAIWQVPQKPTVEAAYRVFSRLWPTVSIHQVKRFVTKLGTVTRERGRMGPRELKNVRPFIRRDWSEFQPNDAWIADGHTFDAEVQHPLHGRPFRPEITVFIDGGTRRVTGWSLGLAENAYGVADALASGVRLCGLPAIVYGDNGAGYRANLLTDEATGLLARIHATPEFALPYNSQAKGIVERLHQTLWVAAARQLPSFVGAMMDREARLAQFKLTRKALKQGGSMPLIPWHVFVDFIAERVAEYNARPHRSLKGLSPDGAWAQWIAQGWQAERLTDAELVTLFRPRVERKAIRGEINLFNNRYFSKLLEEFHGLALHVAYDIHDPRLVWVYTPEGRLICEAECDGNKRAAFPVAVQQQARERRAKGRLKLLDGHRAEVLEELHGSPAIAAPASSQIVIGGRVIDQAELARVPAPAQIAAENCQIAPENCTSVSPPAPPVSRGDRTPTANYAEWQDIDRRLAAGDPVSEADARWHRTFQQHTQFRIESKKRAAA